MPASGQSVVETLQAIEARWVASMQPSSRGTGRRLWQAMTGYLPVVSAASLLAADTPSEQLLSDEVLQTWHRLRLAVLHSIWAASQIAQASRPTQAPDASEPVATLVSSPSSQQASSTSHHGHLARQLVLKTIRAMIRNDWTPC
ncbi:TPA: hypothetical protein ACH3X2_010213 [Trebouxia sp. C0005]